MSFRSRVCEGWPLCIMGFRSRVFVDSVSLVCGADGVRVFVDSVSLVCEVKAGHYMCNGLPKSCVCRLEESGQWNGGWPLRV